MEINYSPITLLNLLSKIFEIVLKNKFTEYVEDNDLISEKLYGFREKGALKKNWHIIDYIGTP